MRHRATRFHAYRTSFTRASAVLLLGICMRQQPANAQPAAEPLPAYQFDMAVDGEYWRNTTGGLQTGQRFLDHGLASLTINGGAAFDIPGLSLYGSTLFTNGQLINGDLIGAAQGISNIEAPSGLRLFEAWAEWHYTDENSLKLGLYDVNSEFDAIDTASLFINPSHGIGPDFSQSGQNGPSIFPSTSLGLRNLHQHGPWTLQLAALDGVPGDPEHPSRSTIRFNHNDGLLLLAETAYESEHGVRAAAGYWRYTADFDDLLNVDANGDAVQRSDNHGYYALVDMNLRPQQEQHTGIDAYVRVGKANAHINPIATYVGGGIVLSHLLPGREDRLGLAMGIVSAGTPFRAAQLMQGQTITRQEHITELTYFIPATHWLSLQPDIQHVQHAGFSNDVSNAWVFGLRFEVTMSRNK
jgi:porin